MPGNRRDQKNEELAGHDALVRRLEAMGLPVTPLPGGRSAVCEISLGPTPFPGVSGPVEFGRVRFATVGAGQIKCLAPEAFFQLPLITIVSCGSPRQIEDRIRAAWSELVRGLREASERLEGCGVEVRDDSRGGGLAFSLGLEDAEAAARCLDARRIVLPSRGPLSGIPVPESSSRLARVDPTLESSVDIEISLTARLEAVVRAAEQADLRRRHAIGIGTEATSKRAPIAKPSAAQAPRGRILLVGGILGRDQALRTAIVNLGFRVRVEYSIAEALDAFRDQTFDVVLTDVHLGRSEGLDLIPELSALPGIDRLPIVLVDEHLRAQRKETARSLGAAGYLVHPIDSERIAPGIARMAAGQRGRRFSRVEHQLDVAWPGTTRGFTRSIGRGGMFIRAQPGVRIPERETCEIALPALGEQIRIATRTIYREDAAGLAETGLGVRFDGFPDRNESRWIEYLTDVMSPPAA